MTLSRSEITKRHQEKCDAIMLRPSKEDGARYRSAARSAGLPVQKFFFMLADQYLAENPLIEEEQGESECT